MLLQIICYFVIFVSQIAHFQIIRNWTVLLKFTGLQIIGNGKEIIKLYASVILVGVIMRTLSIEHEELLGCQILRFYFYV